MVGLAIYQQTKVLVDWLSETFHVVEAASFFHWAGLRNLTGIVDRCEEGEVPRFVADAAVRQYNSREGTNISYAEVRDRCCDYVFSGAGEWVVFTDAAGVQSLLASQTEDPHEAFCNAGINCHWLLYWDVSEGILIVYRSPYVEHRATHEDHECFTLGDHPGPIPSYVLPPEVRGSLRQEQQEEHAFSP